MKKQGYTQRPSRGNGPQRRPNGQNRANNGNYRNGASRKAQKEAVEQWQINPQTLTSHLSTQGNGKPRTNGAGKRADSYNSNGNDQNGNRNRNKPRDKFRSNNNPRSQRPNEQRPRTGKPQETTTAAPANGSHPELDRFELFAAYHLGIGPNKEYKPSNINEVARRFRVDPPTLKQTLKEYDMDSAALLERDFDMALAQLDIQVAPEGIDRKELARNLYREFLEAPVIKRDWKKILDEDRKENMKVFGDR